MTRTDIPPAGTNAPRSRRCPAAHRAREVRRRRGGGRAGRPAARQPPDDDVRAGQPRAPGGVLLVLGALPGRVRPRPVDRRRPRPRDAHRRRHPDRGPARRLRRPERALPGARRVTGPGQRGRARRACGRAVHAALDPAPPRGGDRATSWRRSRGTTAVRY